MLTIGKRYFEKNGKFFPYLADTAWTLLQRLSRGETVYYLDKRLKQGFNAVQVSAISELDGVRKPTIDGLLPFVNGNVKRPCRAYFDKLCFLADECEKRGMVLTLLPYWGDKFNLKWGAGPEIFTPDNAAVYGRFLAGVIGKRENIIWMLGGDRPIEGHTHREIIDETARGLQEGEKVRHLMTYHPNGENSSAFFLRDAEYIDFHCLQSGHSFGGFKSDKLLHKTIVIGKKPAMDAESFYEDFPIDFDLFWNYRLSPLDIRRRIYGNMLMGAAGHTYGHQSVWCFKEKADDEYLFDWKTALDRPAANQMRNINRLLCAVDIMSAKSAARPNGIRVLEGADFAVSYFDSAEPRFLERKRSSQLKYVTWFDPEKGEFSESFLSENEKFTAISPFGHDAAIIFSENRIN